MPNRILRDWTDSLKIDLLKPEEEVLYTRLIMKADDYGNFHANSKMIKSLCFPLKETIRLSDIDRWLGSLEATGLIRKYEAKGTLFLNIINFGQRLRQKKKIFPEMGDSSTGQPLVSDPPAIGGLKRREVETEGEVETKAHAGIVCYDAEQEILKNQIEFEKICMTTGAEISAAKQSLRKYHLYLEEKEQYPKGRKAVFAGFEKWLLNEKKFNNGTHQQAPGKHTGKSAGAYQLLDSLKADIGARESDSTG